jgi:hypothetical protein
MAKNMFVTRYADPEYSTSKLTLRSEVYSLFLANS